MTSRDLVNVVTGDVIRFFDSFIVWAGSQPKCVDGKYSSGTFDVLKINGHGNFGCGEFHFNVMYDARYCSERYEFLNRIYFIYVCANDRDIDLRCDINGDCVRVIMFSDAHLDHDVGFDDLVINIDHNYSFEKLYELLEVRILEMFNFIANGL